jgi:hypothetical protein
MTSDQILSFFASRGSNVFKTASCGWYNDYHQTQLYQSFPMHRLIEPTEDEVRNVFAKARGARAIRFLTSTSAKGHDSFIWIRKAPYDLDNISANTRSRVRRGLKRFEIRSLPFEQLVKQAWEAHRDTASRHGDSEPSSLGLDPVLDKCDAYEAWGAFADNSLAAFVVTMSVESWTEVLVNRSVSAHASSYANNALIFSVVKALLARPNTEVVSYGIEGLIAADSLDRFKKSMGFVQLPVRQRIVLSPALRPLMNPITAAPIAALASLMRNYPRVQRLAGFCRVASQS